MLEALSCPPLASGTMWSTCMPGGVRVRPLDRRNFCRSALLRLIRPCASRVQVAQNVERRRCAPEECRAPTPVMDDCLLPALAKVERRPLAFVVEVCPLLAATEECPPLLLPPDECPPLLAPDE